MKTFVCYFDWRFVGQRILSDQKVSDIDHEGNCEETEKMLLERKRIKSSYTTYHELALNDMHNNVTPNFLEELERKRKSQVMVQEVPQQYPECTEINESGIKLLQSIHWFFKRQDSNNLWSFMGHREWTLKLHHTNLDPRDFSALGYCIANSRQKWNIDLVDCFIDKDCVESLVAAENGRAFDYIKTMNLSNNHRLGDQGAVALGTMLRQNKVLTLLELQNCGLGPKGICEVCSALGENITLTSLDLSGNIFEDMQQCFATTNEREVICYQEETHLNTDITLPDKSSFVIGLYPLTPTAQDQNFYQPVETQLLDCGANLKLDQDIHFVHTMEKPMKIISAVSVCQTECACSWMTGTHKAPDNKYLSASSIMCKLNTVGLSRSSTTKQDFSTVILPQQGDAVLTRRGKEMMRYRGIASTTLYSLMISLLLSCTCATGSVILSPQGNYTVFQSPNPAIFICSGDGTIAVWSINGTPPSGYVGVTITPLDPTLGATIPSNLSIIPNAIATYNNTQVVCSVVTYYPMLSILQSSPTLLIIQGVLQAPSNFSVIIFNTSNTTFLLSWGAPFSLDVTNNSPDIFHYILCTNVTIYVHVCRTIPSDPDCTFPRTCTSSVDFTDPSLNGTNGGQNKTIDYNDPIHFTIFAVNGAGNGSKSNFTFMYIIKTSGQNASSNQTEANVMIPNPTTHTEKANTEATVLLASIITITGFFLMVLFGVVLFFIARRKCQSKMASIEAQMNEYCKLPTSNEEDPYFRPRTDFLPTLQVRYHPDIESENQHQSNETEDLHIAPDSLVLPKPSPPSYENVCQKKSADQHCQYSEPWKATHQRNNEVDAAMKSKMTYTCTCMMDNNNDTTQISNIERTLCVSLDSPAMPTLSIIDGTVCAEVKANKLSICQSSSEAVMADLQSSTKEAIHLALIGYVTVSNKSTTNDPLQVWKCAEYLISVFKIKPNWEQWLCIVSKCYINLSTVETIEDFPYEKELRMVHYLAIMDHSKFIVKTLKDSLSMDQGGLLGDRKKASCIIMKKETGIEKSTFSRRLYEEAMAKGYMETSVTKCLILGAAGFGKTHLKHLLLNEHPPAKRVTTGVADNPVQAVSCTLAGVGEGKDVWYRVNNEKPLQLIAATIRDRSVVIARSLNDVVRELPKMPIHLACQEGTSIDITKETIKQSKAEALPNQIIESITRSSGEKMLLGLKWIQFIDSGGQLQYHDTLPLFVHNCGVTIFALKPSEPLDHHPTIQYIGLNGKPVGKPYQSPLSHRKIVEHCPEAMRLPQNNRPLILIVGTHRDDAVNYEEPIGRKNKQLDALVDTNCFKVFYENNKHRPKWMIFSVNGQVPEEVDRKVAKNIKKKIASKSPSPIKLPIAWFVLEVLFQNSSPHDGILSYSECQMHAKKLYIEGD